MASVLLSETPLPINNQFLKGAMTNVAARMFSDSVHSSKTAGESLQFLEEVELPCDLSWAKSAPSVAGAYARFARTVENAGSFLPLDVRSSVETQIENVFRVSKSLWSNSIGGTDVGCEFGDDAFNAAHRLALLTALAFHAVDEKVVNAFRKHFPEDAQLVGVLAWGSFAAARRIGGQMAKN